MSFSDEQAKRLAAPLDLKRVKKNPKGFDHIEGHDAIRVANDIFGFDGWSHEIREMQSLGGVPVKSDKGSEGWYVAFRAVVRVHALGVFHDGEGFGDGTLYQGAKSQLAAVEGANKEAETDALKRALMKFGDQFGLALYAKDSRTAGHLVTSGSAARTDGNRGSAADTGQRSQAAGPDDPGSFVVNFSATYKGRGLTLAQIYHDENDQGFVKWIAAKSTFEDAKQAATAYLANPTAPATASGVDDDIPFAPTITGYGL